MFPSFHRALPCVLGHTHGSILLSRVPFLGITRKPALSRQRTFFALYYATHHALITSCFVVHL
jgi:hypothetical protein